MAKPKKPTYKELEDQLAAVSKILANNKERAEELTQALWFYLESSVNQAVDVAIEEFRWDSRY